MSWGNSGETGGGLERVQSRGVGGGKQILYDLAFFKKMDSVSLRGSH